MSWPVEVQICWGFFSRLLLRYNDFTSVSLTRNGSVLGPFSFVDNVVNQEVPRAFAAAMADASPSEKDQSILQLQKVDSSRAGSRIISPVFSPTLDSSPVCIPSPYTDLGHDLTSIPFYSPTIFGYGSTSIPDRPAVHRSLSPSLFWPGHGHVGPHIPLHHSQSRPQHGPPIQSPWMDLSQLDGVLTSR